MAGPLSHLPGGSGCRPSAEAGPSLLPQPQRFACGRRQCLPPTDRVTGKWQRRGMPAAKAVRSASLAAGQPIEEADDGSANLSVRNVLVQGDVLVGNIQFLQNAG